MTIKKTDIEHVDETACENCHDTHRLDCQQCQGTGMGHLSSGSNSKCGRCNGKGSTDCECVK